MGSIFIKIFDPKVLYAIYLMVYISRQYQGNLKKQLLKNDRFSIFHKILSKIPYEKYKKAKKLLYNIGSCPPFVALFLD